MKIRERYDALVRGKQRCDDMAKRTDVEPSIGDKDELDRIKDELRQLRKEYQIELLKVQEEYLNATPIVIEGFVDYQEEEIEYDERGRTIELSWFLGCPDEDKQQAWFRRHPKLTYHKFDDISQLLAHFDGKYIKITVEVPSEDERQCNFCEKRFKCLTSR